MPGFTFKGNDTQPNDKEFRSGLSNAVASVAKSGDFSEKVVYTVTRDVIEFAGEVTVKAGVAWNNDSSDQYGGGTHPKNGLVICLD